MDSKVKSAVGELEALFSTKAKGTTVYFNEFNYTPIPQPVTEAVKLIMSDYPELKYRIGLYSVTVLDTDKKKITNGLNKKPVQSETQMGKLHDDFVQAKISESELKDILIKQKGYGKRKAAEVIDKWRPSVIKSSNKTPYEEGKSAWDFYKAFGTKPRNPYEPSIYRQGEPRKESEWDRGFYDAKEECFHPERIKQTFNKSIKSSLSDYFPVDESQAEELEDKISQFDTKSDIRTILEDYFHIYDDYAEMSVEEFDNALDEYFQEMGDGLYEPEETDVDEEEFYTTNYEVDDDLPMDSYDGDDYSESLE